MNPSSFLPRSQRAALLLIATLTTPTFAKVHHLFVGQLSSAYNNVNLTVPPTIYTLSFDDATNNLKLISNITVQNNAFWVGTSPDRKSLFSTSGNGWGQFPITHHPPAPPTLGVLHKITSTSSCNVGPTANQFVFSSTGNLYGCFWGVGNGTGSSDPANCGEVVAPSKSGTYRSVQPFEFGVHPESSIHGLALSPNNKWLYSADMKADILYTHSVNPRTGLVNTASVGKRPVLPSGSHPRHVAVHTSGKRVYTIQEGANTLNEYDSSGHHASNPILVKEWDFLASLPVNRSHYWSSEVVVDNRGTYIFASTRTREGDVPGYYNVFRANKKNGKIERVARREETKYTDMEVSLQFRTAKWSPKGVTYLANPRVNYGEGQAGVEVLKWDEKREKLEVVADLQIEDKGCCASVDWLGD